MIASFLIYKQCTVICIWKITIISRVLYHTFTIYTLCNIMILDKILLLIRAFHLFLKRYTTDISMFHPSWITDNIRTEIYIYTSCLKHINALQLHISNTLFLNLINTCNGMLNYIRKQVYFHCFDQNSTPYHGFIEQI